ncbi:MAG: branched-chain amino acid ABC transporter permease [Candidatus Bathyarchaeia archaeon]
MGFLIYVLDTLIFVGIFAILALSLNLEAGFTNLMNFGKVAFFAVGAYTSAILTLHGLPFAVGVVMAAILAGFSGFLIAIPTLRLTEEHLAIVTIAAGEILRLFLLSETWLTNGSVGLSGIPRPMFSVFRENYHLFYVGLVFLFLFIFYLIAERIVYSPFGRVLKAIREDETATKALGKNVFMFKTKSFVIGSGMAGVAGSLFAHYITFIAPIMFLPTLTFSVWIMIIIGGRANNLGVILGAVLIQLFERSTRFIKDFVTLPFDPANVRLIVIGLLLILFMIYRPEGVLEERKVRSLVKR